jgi:phosphoenolpyruvate carboxykinase (ATP)
MVRAVLNGGCDKVSFRKDPNFGFDVPLAVPGVDSKLLNPRDMWPDPDAYDRAAADLASKFHKAFDQFRNLVRPEVSSAGP